MSTTTVRVTPENHAVLQELARESNQPMQVLIAKAVEQYRRQLVLQRADDAYAELRARPEAWAEQMEERRGWEARVADDLEGGE